MLWRLCSTQVSSIFIASFRTVHSLSLISQRHLFHHVQHTSPSHHSLWDNMTTRVTVSAGGSGTRTLLRLSHYLCRSLGSTSLLLPSNRHGPPGVACAPHATFILAGASPAETTAAATSLSAYCSHHLWNVFVTLVIQFLATALHEASSNKKEQRRPLSHLSAQPSAKSSAYNRPCRRVRVLHTQFDVISQTDAHIPRYVISHRFSPTLLGSHLTHG